MKGHIQYLTHSQIDKIKWDSCIDKADNGLIYALSYYLDIMSPGWDALVMNDYETVMPLTCKKKWGIRYLYQPFLTAQLGVFGKNIFQEQVSFFLKSIPPSFRLIEISLNYGNKTGSNGSSIFDRQNFILHLNKSYEELYNSYSENIKRNIKKSITSGCIVVKNFNVEEVINLAVQQMQTYGKESAKNVKRFWELYKLLYDKKMSMTYGVMSVENKLLASCVFFFSHNRAYYILVGNHPEGKATGASHALIDAFIRDYAGKTFPDGQTAMILDFEGSDIPSLAKFYSGFGGVQEVYPALKINRLPFYLKWLK